MTETEIEFISAGLTLRATLRQLLALDVKALVDSVRCPTLVIGGGKDVQCDPGDVERIARAANAVVEAHVLPDLTHVLRSDSQSPSLFRYGELLAQPVEPRLLELMTSWIQKRNRLSPLAG